MPVRVVVGIVCSLVGADLLLIAPLCFFLGWKFPLTESLISAGIGMLVIGYYEWRWAGVIAEHLGGEYPEPLRTAHIEKILLIVAGVFLIVPGIMSSALGVALLLPAVRRWTAHMLPSLASDA